MKITCSSCGSKYTIADAKVQGKKVKVRCKGCKESILVDGTQIGADGSSGSEDDDSENDGDAPAAASPAQPAAAAATPAAAAAATAAQPAAAAPAKAAPGKAAEQKPVNSPALNDGAKSDLWSVNLSDDDSRDMTLDELVAGWKNGTVTSDAYVWKDGMGDWKPILEVGELKLKLGTPKKSGGVVSSVSPAVAKGGAKMDDLFGGADAAASKGADKGAGLPGAEAKATGARNDSSVLFSLDSLTGPAGGAPQAPSGGADLFAGLGNVATGALAGNVDLLTAPAKDPPPAPAGNRAQPIPVEKGKNKVGLILAIVGGLVVIGGAVFALSGGNEGAKPTEPSAEEATAAAAAKEAAEKAKKELEEKMKKLAKMEEELKKKAEAEKKAEPSAEEKKKQEELEKEKAEAEKKAAAEKAASGSTTTGSSSGSTPAPAPAASASAAFDVGAARAALNAAAANAAACAKPGGPTGSGKVQITFATSGRVTTATLVSGPFGGTAVGGCVASTFRRARVPAFSGSPQTVAKSFTVN